MNIFSKKTVKKIGQPEKSKPASKIFDCIIKSCVYLAVFLVPIFFLPFTSDVLEFNKASLFYLLGLVAGVTWFIKIIIQREITVRRTRFDFLVILLGVAWLISSFISVHRYSSLIGMSGYYNHSLISLLFFTLFYFLIINNFHETKEVFRLFYLLIISSGLLAAFNIFQVFGRYLLPIDVTKANSFNLLSNSSSALSLYLALFVVLSLSLLIYLKSKVGRLGLVLAFLLGFVLMFLVDKNIGWYTLILGLFGLVIFISLRAKEINSRWIIPPTILLALSLLFVFINTSKITKVNLPNDIVLPQRTSLEITRAAIGKVPLFGSGPATFVYDFVAGRPTEFNNSSLWTLRFIKSANEWTQILATVGLLGTLVFLGLVGWFLISLGRMVIGQKGFSPEWVLALGLFLAGAMIFLALFLYPLNFVLSFLFWLILASGVVVNKKESKIITSSFQNSSLASLGSSIVFSLIIVLGISFLYFGVRFWLADYYYYRGNQLASASQDLGKVKNYFSKAVELNRYQSNYHFAYAQALITQARLLASQGTGSLAEIQPLVAQSIDEINQAVAMDKNYPATYETKASLYQGLETLAGGTGTVIEEAYQKAISLDPNNPAIQVWLGQYELVEAQTLLAATGDEAQTKDNKTKATELISKAMAAFTKAQGLKKDYLEAGFSIALAQELNGNRDQGIATLKSLTEVNPMSVDLWYELGRMYLAQEKLDEARLAFLQAVAIMPNHSNSHWQLAAIYEKKGDKAKAIQELEIVKQYNPDNTQVVQKIEELKK